MDIPKLRYVSNKETEIERIVHTAKQMWSGFYFKKGFAILPKLIGNPAICVVFPDIGIETIPEIGEKLKNIKLNFPIEMTDDFRSEIDKKFEYTKIERTAEKEWKKIEADFWEVIGVLVPRMVETVEEIEVRTTRYGTIGSYQFLNKKSNKMIVYVRSDGNVANLAEAIVTGLVYPYLGEMGMIWEEGEAMVDFVLTNSKLSYVFSKYEPTLRGLRENNLEKLRDESKKYLKKMGIFLEKPIVINGGKIELYGKEIDRYLTVKQRRLMRLMLEKEEIITFDEVAKILWNDDENKFSLWAMNKYIERLRNKLMTLGLSPLVLKTLRGRGICLEN